MQGAPRTGLRRAAWRRNLLMQAIAAAQTPIAHLKALIEATTSVPQQRQRLIFRGAVLGDASSVAAAGEFFFPGLSQPRSCASALIRRCSRRHRVWQHDPPRRGPGHAGSCRCAGCAAPKGVRARQQRLQVLTPALLFSLLLLVAAAAGGGHAGAAAQPDLNRVRRAHTQMLLLLSTHACARASPRSTRMPVACTVCAAAAGRVFGPGRRPTNRRRRPRSAAAASPAGHHR